MQYRKLEKLNKEVSLLGVGTMRFPMNGDEIDLQQVEEMIEYAMESGVNYYDHAWFYHNYKSETLMGQVLSKYDRDKFYIADKMPLWECKCEEDIEKLFLQQLKNLQTDYIDFYLVHAMSKERIEAVKKWNVFEKLEKWQREGKIKHIGFSYHDDHDTFPKVVEMYDWDFALIQLNYLDVDHQQGISGYELLKSKGIPAFIMEPVKGGKLASFHEDINKIFLDYDNDRSIASWSLKWLANLDNVYVIVSGMSNKDQLKDNVETLSNFKPLTKEEEELIDKVYNEIIKRATIACTECKYCMPCPVEVNIPKVFKTYNDYQMFNDERELTNAYKALHKDKQLASQCIYCNKCIDLCPQKLDIPKLLEIAATVDNTEGENAIS